MNIANGEIILSEHEQQRRADFIRGLRDLADWYDSRPGLVAPYIPAEAFFIDHSFGRDELAAFVREVGSVRKVSDKHSDDIALTRDFGPLVRFRLMIDKEKTCKRVKVGTKVVPAKPALEVDVYEWECGESILGSLSPDAESLAAVEETADA